VNSHCLSGKSKRELPDGNCAKLEQIPVMFEHSRHDERRVINRHVDQQKLEFLRTAEKSERELLTAWAATYRGSAR
jgi:hypothetical protein